MTEIKINSIIQVRPNDVPESTLSTTFSQEQNLEFVSEHTLCQNLKMTF